MERWLKVFLHPCNTISAYVTSPKFRPFRNVGKMPQDSSTTASKIEYFLAFKGKPLGETERQTGLHSLALLNKRFT
jgi:hypothetical protein